MATTAIAKLGATLKFDDGSEILVFEGDILHDLVYKSGTALNTITGAVRVISASTKAQNTGPDTCPPEPYVYKSITPSSLVIDYSDEMDAQLISINISNIVSIGSVTTEQEAAEEGMIVVGPGGSYKDLTEVIADAPAGSVVKLRAGEYTAPVAIDKSIEIIGDGSAIISGAITVTGSEAVGASADGDAGLSVKISGVKLTGDALISVSNADEFILENCEFSGHNMSAKTMPVAIKTENPMLLKITDNIFGDQNANSYNLIDVYAKLKDGSSISGNTFSAACCVHNQISLYGLADGATINIDDNYAAVSKNMVRIGFKGAPVGMVNMNANQYDETDADPAWAGLFLVQPYGKNTSSFAGLTIKVNKTVKPEGQIGYLYAGGSDTPFDASNKPVFYLDGTKTELPDSSPV